MTESDSLAHVLSDESRRAGIQDGGHGLPAPFGDTRSGIHAPVVSDDRRLQALQAPLRQHRSPLIAAAAPLIDLILVLAQHELDVAGTRRITPGVL